MEATYAIGTRKPAPARSTGTNGAPGSSAYNGDGVVTHVHAGHGPGRYVLARGGEREYLVCERCGRLTAVYPAQLDAVRERVREAFGYEARFTHFPIHGLCADCAAE